jgi:hypothetical protein
MVGACENHALHAVAASPFVHVEHSDDVRIQDRVEVGFHRDAAEVHDGVRAFHERERRRPVAQVALHDLFALPRGSERLAIRQAKHPRPRSHALAQDLAEAARGTRQEETFELLHVEGDRGGKRFPYSRVSRANLSTCR